MAIPNKRLYVGGVSDIDGARRARCVGCRIGDLKVGGFSGACTGARPADSERAFCHDPMANAVRQSRQLMLPQPDKADTDWSENVREETIPASPPEGSSTLATAVLAVSLSARVDLDADGFPDADNDRDGRP